LAKIKGGYTMVKKAPPPEVGSLLVRARKEIGITQTALARKLKVSPGSVKNWEYGVSSPNMAQIKNLCRILRISPEEIVEVIYPEAQKPERRGAVISEPEGKSPVEPKVTQTTREDRLGRIEAALEATNEMLQRHMQATTPAIDAAQNLMERAATLSDEVTENLRLLAYTSTGQICYASEALCKLLDTSREAMLGDQWASLWPPAEANRRLDEYVPVLLNQGFVPTEGSALTSGGKLVPVVTFTWLGRYRGMPVSWSLWIRNNEIQEVMDNGDAEQVYGRLTALQKKDLEQSRD
jgi:transcriptional regulator with XRE-family HTH domain